MSLFGGEPAILEVTLRDGSYLIDFQFTADDTAAIASALEGVGFRWIEVGHGLGLNASASGKGRAAATDEEYLEAAARSLAKARWGMFFIPDIGRAEDLRLAARYGMGFVRIGTNTTEVEKAEPFVALAKELGLVVSYNAMKSYAIAPDAFARLAARVRSWGADVVYLVDSAGGMYPDEVRAYVAAARGASDVALGFHGHDNLSLVMANTLAAIEAGAALVDSSLQGMGRSAGNAVTEVLVAVLKRRGLLGGVDLNAVMDIGQGLIQPLMRQRGMDPMAVTAGYAQFHSSYTAKVESYARRYGIDPRDLIVRLCQEDRVGAPDELLERLGRELAEAKMPRTVSVPTLGKASAKRLRGPEALRELLKELRPRAVKAEKFSTLNIVLGDQPADDLVVSGNVQQAQAHVIGSATVTSDAQLAAALEAADGAVDVVFLDVDRKPFGPAAPARSARERLRKSLLLTYSDARVWVEAVEQQAARLAGDALDEVQVVVAGDHPRSRLLAANLAGRGARVAIIARERSSRGAAPASSEIARHAAGSPGAGALLDSARLVVVWPSAEPWFGAAEASRLVEGTYVVDAGIGGIGPDALEEGRRRGVLFVRVHIWPALGGALLAAHESERACRERLGWGTLAGVRVVAGGAMGQRGDVVVDSIREPTRVIGVSDGRGGIVFGYDAEEAERVRRVTEEIGRRFLEPRWSVDR